MKLGNLKNPVMASWLREQGLRLDAHRSCQVLSKRANCLSGCRRREPLHRWLPVSLIELSSQIMLHKFNSPAWLKHIQKANAALAALTPEKLANLSVGEAYVWSSKATDDIFSKGAVKIRCRPRVTRHGGITRTAVPHE